MGSGRVFDYKDRGVAGVSLTGGTASCPSEQDTLSSVLVLAQLRKTHPDMTEFF